MSITKLSEQRRNKLSCHLVDWDDRKRIHKEILNSASCFMKFLRVLKVG